MKLDKGVEKLLNDFFKKGIGVIQKKMTSIDMNQTFETHDSFKFEVDDMGGLLYNTAPHQWYAFNGNKFWSPKDGRQDLVAEVLNSLALKEKLTEHFSIVIEDNVAEILKNK